MTVVVTVVGLVIACALILLGALSNIRAIITGYRRCNTLMGIGWACVPYIGMFLADRRIPDDSWKRLIRRPQWQVPHYIGEVTGDRNYALAAAAMWERARSYEVGDTGKPYLGANVVDNGDGSFGIWRNPASVRVLWDGYVRGWDRP
jgi:hypothetical protein